MIENAIYITPNQVIEIYESTENHRYYSACAHSTVYL